MERVILVTGGSGGIGSAIVRSLLSDGISTIILDEEDRPEGCEKAEFVRCDLADLSQIDAVCDDFTSKDMRFNGIVHVAAITEHHRLVDEPREQWLRILAINLVAPIALTQRLAPLIVNGGSVLFFGSGLFLKGEDGLAAYTASKGGLVGFARSLASELGERGITVNTVSPGLTATKMMAAEREEKNITSRAIKRREVPEDVVGAVRFFLSPASRFCTGQLLMVDGGSTRH